MQKLWTGILGLGAFLALGAMPASAGKSDDTLRVAVVDWWSTLDPYQFPLDEAGVFYRGVYETLVRYDERAHKIVPRLAKAWRQVDDKTVEFDLRDDVKFHNGDHFDADDVVSLRCVLDGERQPDLSEGDDGDSHDGSILRSSGRRPSAGAAPRRYSA